MVFSLDIVRSDATSHQVMLDGKQLDNAELQRGCSRYKLEVSEGLHRVDVYIRKIVKKYGESLLSMAMYNVVGNSHDVLKEGEVECFSFDVEVTEGKDRLYIGNDGGILKSYTTVEVIDTSRNIRYEKTRFKEFMRFSLIFFIPLVTLVSVFLLLSGIAMTVKNGADITGVGFTVAGGLMALMLIVYIIKLILLRNTVNKFSIGKESGNGNL